MKCTDCGYWYTDVTASGVPINTEYCHYDGPDNWAPCAQDDPIYETEDYDE